jgi:hypothetical protein
MSAEWCIQHEAVYINHAGSTMDILKDHFERKLAIHIRGIPNYPTAFNCVVFYNNNNIKHVYSNNQTGI